MTDEKIHQKYMRVAIKEAHQAQLLGEVPIGAVIVHNGQIIASGHNMRERFQDVTYHAEMLAIMEACTALNSWRLEDCDLYVTLEPCIMCSGAIVNARIKNVYYGARDPKAGAVDSLYHLLGDQRLNHQVHVESGILGEECSQMLKDFFRTVRKKKKLSRKKRWTRG
ncbi:MAG: tRNA adenosine(34) deaminase TadA [Limosilactobacillus pontis]|nr:tRNA adenosine(34) deaminase TadA [Limosilactobacillus pontis]